MQLTKNFSRKELECNCGCGQCRMNPELLEILQEIRDEMCVPIYINSGYRCKEHNFSVGGTANSQHLVGKAVDVKTKDWDATLFAKFLKYCFAHEAIKGYGFGKGFLHIDVRDTKDIIAWRY